MTRRVGMTVCWESGPSRSRKKGGFERIPAWCSDFGDRRTIKISGELLVDRVFLSEKC